MRCTPVKNRRTPVVANVEKEKEYEFLRRRGFGVAGIVVDTCGGVAESTIKFLAQAVRDHTPEVGEWAARIEAAIVHLQFGMIGGMQAAVADQIRRAEVQPEPPRLLWPIVGAGTKDCAAREAQATM